MYVNNSSSPFSALEIYSRGFVDSPPHTRNTDLNRSFPLLTFPLPKLYAFTNTEPFAPLNVRQTNDPIIDNSFDRQEEPRLFKKSFKPFLKIQPFLPRGLNFPIKDIEGPAFGNDILNFFWKRIFFRVTNKTNSPLAFELSVDSPLLSVYLKKKTYSESQCLDLQIGEGEKITFVIKKSKDIKIPKKGFMVNFKLSIRNQAISNDAPLREITGIFVVYKRILSKAEFQKIKLPDGKVTQNPYTEKKLK